MLLPDLQVLVLGVYSNSIGEALVDIIESRRRSDTSVPHNVLLVFSHLFRPLINPHLDSCGEGGLNISLSLASG